MALELLLARQAGVISRAQALRAGLSARAVDRMVRTRRWQPLHPRVYLAGNGPPGDEARARAAVLWAGEGAVLSGAAAAWWLGLLGQAPSTVGVTTPIRRPGRPGIAVRWRLLDAADRTEHRGVAVTALGLTVLEAAAELDGTAGAALLDRTLQHRAARAAVLVAHRRHPTAATRTVLSAAAARSAAAADAVLVRLLRGAGLSGWYRLPARAGRPPTTVFPAARVAVETVGLPVPAAARTRTATRPHGARGSRARGPRLADEGDAVSRGSRSGWRVLRFDLAELTAGPATVLATVAAAVAGRDLRHVEPRIGPPTGGSS